MNSTKSVTNLATNPDLEKKQSWTREHPQDHDSEVWPRRGSQLHRGEHPSRHQQLHPFLGGRWRRKERSFSCPPQIAREIRSNHKTSQIKVGWQHRAQEKHQESYFRRENCLSGLWRRKCRQWAQSARTELSRADPLVPATRQHYLQLYAR